MAGLPEASDCAWLTQLQRSKLGQHIRVICIFLNQLIPVHCFMRWRHKRWVFRSRHSLLITAGRSCATPTSEWAGKGDFHIQILSLVHIRSQWRNFNHPDIRQLPDLWPLTCSPWLISPMNWKHKTLTPIRWYLECQSVSLTFNPGLKYVQRAHMYTYAHKLKGIIQCFFQKLSCSKDENIDYTSYWMLLLNHYTY